jgi:hypothetical protein
LAYVALHAPDALRIAKGLVRLDQALAQHARTAKGVRVAADNRQTVV